MILKGLMAWRVVGRVVCLTSSFLFLDKGAAEKWGSLGIQRKENIIRYCADVALRIRSAFLIAVLLLVTTKVPDIAGNEDVRGKT
jgi:hypothetical protein